MTAVPRVEEAQQDLARVLTPKSISTAPLAGAARPHLAVKLRSAKISQLFFLVF